MVEKSKLRIAVVGAGLIGRKHIDLVAQLAQLAAIVDPDASAEALAATHHAEWFEDLETCLAKGKVDGVIVASPNKLHLEHGTACLKAGLPVLIEKPLADTVEAGRALVSLSDTTGVPILVGHHRRHSPIVQAALSVVQSGQLGRVVTVNALFWLNKPGDYFEVPWRRNTGGGPTYINLIHDIDLLQHLCGPITHVQAAESNAVRGFDVEDTAAVILHFESGTIGTASICDTVSSPWSWELTAGENPAYPQTDQSCYLLAGTKGSLSIPDLRIWTHSGEQSWWSPMETRRMDVVPTDPVEGQFRHFLEVITNNETPVVTAADALRNIEVLEAIKAAGRAERFAVGSTSRR